MQNTTAASSPALKSTTAKKKILFNNKSSLSKGSKNNNSSSSSTSSSIPDDFPSPARQNNTSNSNNNSKNSIITNINDSVSPFASATSSPLLHRASHLHFTRRARFASNSVSTSETGSKSTTGVAATTNTTITKRRNRVGHGFFTFSVIVGSIVSSVATVMVNKLVLNSGFPFASTLTALHQLFAYLVTSALIAAGLVPKVPHSIVTTTRAATTATAVTSWLRNLPRRRFFVATLYASGLVLMNQSLGLNSVSFYQLLKMSCIPVIALLQFFMYGTVLPRKTTIALTLILIGVSISTTAESSTYIKNPHHHPPSNSHHYYTTNNYESATTATSFLTLLSHTRPLLTSLAAVTTTSLSQILLTRSPDLQRLSSLQCIHALAGTSFFVCGVCAVAVDVGVSPADWARLVLGLTPGVGAVVPTAGVEFLVFGGEEEVSVARQQKQMIAAATAAAAGGSAGNDLHEFLGGVSSRAYLAEHILGKFINFFNKISITNSAEAATAAKSSLHSSFGTSTGSTTRSGITTATVASGLHPAFSNIFVWVLFSCVLGVVTNLFGFAVIKQTSPITYQVIGHFKTVSTMAIGVLLFGDVLGGISGAVGIFLAIVGMMIYSQK